jgi:hypothetical protein
MKQVQVIRSNNQTMVIYKDAPAPRKKKAKVPMSQKAIPVYVMGKFQYYVLPNGKIHYPKRSIFKRIKNYLMPKPRPAFVFA